MKQRTNSTQPRQVPVITGLGVVSPFGIGQAAFFRGLEAGLSAVGPLTVFDAQSFPVQVAAQVPVADVNAAWLSEQGVLLAPFARDRIERASQRWQATGALRDRKLGFGVLAALEAWHSAGLSAAHPEASSCLGLGLEQALLEDFAPLLGAGHIDWQKEPRGEPPDQRFRTPVDLTSRVLTELLGLGGQEVVHVSACAAGTLALAHAAALVERGASELVLAGGVDSMLNPLGFGGMARLGALSPRNSADACRPFDLARDGLVMGEGAACFVVEAEGHARARAAQPLARVLGWGSSQDGYRATAPLPDGSAAAHAIERALTRAGLEPHALDYINAHGTGTPLNDVAEVRALERALGPAAKLIPVSSIKGAVGHLMAAAGAIEIAACLFALNQGVLPGTAHYRTRDPECDLDIIGPEPRSARARAVLKNSFGFGGQNASLVLGSA